MFGKISEIIENWLKPFSKMLIRRWILFFINADFSVLSGQKTIQDTAVIALLEENVELLSSCSGSCLLKSNQSDDDS